jgi:hypothetical protein
MLQPRIVALNEFFHKIKEERFNGSDYEHKVDHSRLRSQILRVYSAMRDGQWRTLEEIHRLTGDPTASISAQLRHLRKARFGRFIVNKRSLGHRIVGLYEYQVLDPDKVES